MANGEEFITDLEFESHIKDMNDRQLQEFTARQVYDVCSVVSKHAKRIVALEKKSNKIIGAAGAVGTGIGAGVIAIISYFTNK